MCIFLGSPIRAKILKNNVFDHFKTEAKDTEEYRVEKLNEPTTPSFTYLRLNKEVMSFLARFFKEARNKILCSN